MATILNHEIDCIKILGIGYIGVHQFLDQYAWNWPPNKYVEYHRTFLHNSYGLAIVKANFGLLGEVAGKIHIYRDFFYLNPKDHNVDYVVKKVDKEALPELNNFKCMELPQWRVRWDRK
jgi:hypothetical protein